MMAKSFFARQDWAPHCTRLAMGLLHTILWCLINFIPDVDDSDMSGVCLDEFSFSSLSARAVKCSPIRAQNSCRNVLSWWEMHAWLYKFRTISDLCWLLKWTMCIHRLWIQPSYNSVAMTMTLPVSMATMHTHTHTHRLHCIYKHGVCKTAILYMYMYRKRAVH